MIAAGIALRLCAVVAVALSLRVREHRPIAVYLVLLAVRSDTRALLDPLFAAPGPYAGWMRVVFHVDQALWMIDSFALPWLAVNVFAPGAWKGRLGSPLRFALPWMAMSLLVARAYPEFRGERLRLFYTALECGSLLICVAYAGAWLRHGGPLARLRTSTLTERIALTLVGASFALLFVGAWPLGLWGVAWKPQQAGLLALYGGLAIAQGLAWWRARSSP